MRTAINPGPRGRHGLRPLTPILSFQVHNCLTRQDHDSSHFLGRIRPLNQAVVIDCVDSKSCLEDLPGKAQSWVAGFCRGCTCPALGSGPELLKVGSESCAGPGIGSTSLARSQEMLFIFFLLSGLGFVFPAGES